MEHDPARKKLKELLWKRGVSMSEASLALGRSKSYVHQYLERGSPAMLTYPDSETLAGLLGCDGAELRPATPPKRKPVKPHRRRPAPGAGLSAVPEMEVEAAAGPGALNEEFAAETARWHLPEGMLRHEGGAAPENLRILRVRGNSMEPEMRRGRPHAGRHLPARARHRRDVRALGRQRPRGQARRGGARRAAPAAADLGQPGLRALYLPRRGRPRHRQGGLGGEADVSGSLLGAIHPGATM